MREHEEFRLCVALSVAGLAVLSWTSPAGAVPLYKCCMYGEPPEDPYCCDWKEEGCTDPDACDATVPQEYCSTTPVPCCRGLQGGDCVWLDASCCEALGYDVSSHSSCTPRFLACPPPEFSPADDDDDGDGVPEASQATTSSGGMWGLLLAALVVLPAVPIAVARRRAARRK